MEAEGDSRALSEQSDAPRPGTPVRYSAGGHKIVALSCEAPKACGYPISQTPQVLKQSSPAHRP